MKIIGYVCGPRLYQFEGWYFEVHSYCGPVPLNKDGEIRQTPPGRKFWQMWERFSALPPDEQARYRVGGYGCTPLVSPNGESD